MNAKNALYNAIRDILPENDIEDITVEDILQKADVSRATFYKYFKDKYDLTTSYYRVTFIERFEKNGSMVEKYTIRHEQMAFIKENKAFCKSLLKYKGPNSFYEFMEQYALQRYINIFGYEFDLSKWSLDKRLEFSFYVAGLIKIFEIWVNNDCNDDEMYFDACVKLIPEEFW